MSRTIGLIGQGVIPGSSLPAYVHTPNGLLTDSLTPSKLNQGSVVRTDTRYQRWYKMGIFRLITLMLWDNLFSVSKQCHSARWRPDLSGKRSRKWLRIAACTAGFAPHTMFIARAVTVPLH